MEQGDNLKVQLEAVKERIRALQEQRCAAEQTLATVDKRVMELKESQATLANQIDAAKAKITFLTAKYADGEPVEKSLHRLKATCGTLETKLATVMSALDVAGAKREESVRHEAQIEKAVQCEQEKFWRLIYEIELPKAISQVRRLLYAANGGKCSRDSRGWAGFYAEDVEWLFVRKFFDANNGDVGTMQAVQQQLLEEYGSPLGEGGKTGLLSKFFRS